MRYGRDLFDQIHDLLWFEASRRPSLWWGKRPNAAAIARAMGGKVVRTTVQRIINGERHLEAGEERRGYRPSIELEEGLMLLIGAKTRSDLAKALEKAPRLRTASSR
jgi:hypothetical protein